MSFLFGKKKGGGSRDTATPVSGGSVTPREKDGKLAAGPHHGTPTGSINTSGSSFGNASPDQLAKKPESQTPVGHASLHREWQSNRLTVPSHNSNSYRDLS